MGVNRRLAAVVFADVAGYARLMERDEVGTYERLQALLKDVFAPGIAGHGGRMVHSAGDGLLLEFPSTTSALRWAVDFQRVMGQRNRAAAPESRIEFRIGINPGDVMNLDGGSSTQLCVRAGKINFSEGFAEVPVAIGFFRRTP